MSKLIHTKSKAPIENTHFHDMLRDIFKRILLGLLDFLLLLLLLCALILLGCLLRDI